jgi:AraC-like DNA-binding protein
MKQATRDRLARALGIKPSYLAKILSGIRRISPDAYFTSYRLHKSARKTSQGGPPRVFYELNGERLATYPETAFLLLQLMQFPREIAKRINLDDFKAHFMSLTDLDNTVISGRLDWAIRNDYVTADENQAYISCGERTVLEQPYLELLAANCKGYSAQSMSA